MVQRSARSTSTRHTPIRMCLGCRQRAETSELIRVVAREHDTTATVVVDPAKTMPGRGAWLHPRTECISTAVRRKAFGSALRVPGLTVDADDLAEQLGAVAPQQDSSESEQVAEDMSTP